ncbi:hypothetical protein [Actinophytocola sp.]|uniref:hypothetical protein n=1 Tax=Actinophytocola sp. TaxID=1872138 RepID=UPI002ED51346
MRGKSVVVDNNLEMENTVADLISRGYLLMNQGTRRATLVRPRTGRFLGVLVGLCGLLTLVLVIAAAFADSGEGASIVMIVFLFVIMPIGGLLRFVYVHVRRDQVMHVLVRDQ